MKSSVRGPPIRIRQLSVKYFTSCLERSRSSTDKFEIGRNDFASTGSMFAFFKIGVMYADFILDGTTPCCRDQQNRWRLAQSGVVSQTVEKYRGHWRSSNPIRYRSATYDLLLSFHTVTIGVIGTVSEINCDLSRKSRIFASPVYFFAQAIRVLRGIGYRRLESKY